MVRVMTAALVALALNGAEAAPLSETACHVNGFETPVRCVSVAVPLDYAAPDGPQIKITAAIVPATTARPAEDPLIVLAGGPGQAATGMAPWLDSAFKPARRARDIVLFDIRGTGLSGRIDCAFSLTAAFRGAEQARQDGAACAERFGASAAFFSSREIVEDLERFRRAMGYARVNFWGGSFGTRIAQHYIRAYGAHVRASVLDAATPVGTTIVETAPQTGEAALALLFADCVHDAACNGAFPNLKADLATLIARAERGEIAYEAPDPREGRLKTGSIDRDGVVALVRGALYVGMTRALVPYAISQGARGDVKPLLALGSATAEWSVETMSLGSMLGIICAEDWAQARKLEPAALNGPFMRHSFYHYFAAACSGWPARELPASMFAPLSAKSPAMVISGEADPVTPPSLGAAVLKQFASGVHVVIPHAFHTNSSNTCIAELIGAFLDDPMAGARDQTCVKRVAPPRFMTSPNA
jgi:pimeloyl-ACP methyl ester carboxylesterase